MKLKGWKNRTNSEKTKWSNGNYR